MPAGVWYRISGLAMRLYEDKTTYHQAISSRIPRVVTDIGMCLAEMRRPLIKGFVERLHCMLSDECYTFRAKTMDYHFVIYNTKRPHPECNTTPMPGSRNGSKHRRKGLQKR